MHCVKRQKTRKEETMTLNKAAAPPARSAMPAATGNISRSSSSRTVVKSIAMVDEQGSKVRDGFSTEMEELCTNFFVPKKKSWDLHQVRLLRCGILPSSLRVLSFLLISLAGLNSMSFGNSFRHRRTHRTSGRLWLLSCCVVTIVHCACNLDSFIHCTHVT